MASSSSSTIQIRGSTKVSLNERFANLPKKAQTSSKPVNSAPPPSREPIYRDPPPPPRGYRYQRSPSPPPPPPPRYRNYADYDYPPSHHHQPSSSYHYHHPRHIPEYRGPPRTATAMPVYDTPYRPPSYRYSRGDSYGGGNPHLKRPLKHRLGSLHQNSSYSSSYRGRGSYRGSYDRGGYDRGGGGRGRGRFNWGSEGGGRGRGGRGGPPERGNWRGGGARGRGSFGYTSSSLSKEDLDSEMDAYMAQTKGGLDKEIDSYMNSGEDVADESTNGEVDQAKD